MKKLTALLLCLALCLSSVALLASCDKSDKTDETTAGSADTTAPENENTEAPTEEATEEATEESTEAPTEENTDAGDKPEDPGDVEYDPETHVVIASAEDLMAFNKAVNEDFEYFDDKTVVFTADIDMTGYTWTPLDSNGLYNVTFDGNGHTISNLQFADYEYEAGMAPSNGEKGCGFVGAVTSDLTFLDLTFENTKITAYDQAVGNFVGSIRSGSVWFENCKSIGFTVDGWVDWNNQDRANGGHSIAMRVAGFVGHILGSGTASFDNCAVENVTLSGFHNLAGYVGYDSTSTIDSFSFTNCTVKNASFTFSYCLSESYTIDQPRKFVSVFYNGANWVDNIDACLEMENSFEDVTFYDWSDNNAPYTPSDFRSWTQEEADDAAKA